MKVQCAFFLVSPVYQKLLVGRRCRKNFGSVLVSVCQGWLPLFYLLMLDFRMIRSCDSPVRGDVLGNSAVIFSKGQGAFLKNKFAEILVFGEVGDIVVDVFFVDDDFFAGLVGGVERNIFQ